MVAAPKAFTAELATIELATGGAAAMGAAISVSEPISRALSRELNKVLCEEPNRELCDELGDERDELGEKPGRELGIMIIIFGYNIPIIAPTPAAGK